MIRLITLLINYIATKVLFEGHICYLCFIIQEQRKDKALHAKVEAELSKKDGMNLGIY